MQELKGNLDFEMLRAMRIVFKPSFNLFDAEFHVKADDEIYLRPDAATFKTTGPPVPTFELFRFMECKHFKCFRSVSKEQAKASNQLDAWSTTSRRRAKSSNLCLLNY
ncbi:hypothetical protein C4D60_Mb02t16400 [Musa balbisiana]|uniref:Uncharacterized protein n=1 Tax=Musa balbisiana TaxID=52838 RepID=A0A4S8IBA8_MUSBA|nr:hypothetical protein C4D60_Mb02t16400 [Musa balbisiana]